MIKAAMEKVLDLSRPEVIDPYSNGKKYMIDGYERVTEPTARPIELSTLTGLMDYIKADIDLKQETGPDLKLFFIHITDYNRVVIRSELFGDFRQRERLVISKAEVPELSTRWMDVEDFIINLNSKFVHSFDYEYLVKLVSSLTQAASQELKDNGISQSTVVKNGLSMVQEQEVKNPLTLQPFRTFPEIDQPEIEYLFRLQARSGPPECALFEADGGRWKLETMQKIKTWFESRLEEEGITMDVIA